MTGPKWKRIQITLILFNSIELNAHQLSHQNLKTMVKRPETGHNALFAPQLMLLLPSDMVVYPPYLASILTCYTIYNGIIGNALVQITVLKFYCSFYLSLHHKHMIFPFMIIRKCDQSQNNALLVSYQIYTQNCIGFLNNIYNWAKF